MGKIKLSKVVAIMSLLLMFLIASQTVFADGILPSLSETVGIAMPSLGEALQRYPDKETEGENGGVMELYTNVSEEDFNSFSVYLKEQGAELADYQVNDGVLTAEIQLKNASIFLSYDSHSGEANMLYPAGTYDERVKTAKNHLQTAEKLLEKGKSTEAYAEIREIPQFDKYYLVGIDLVEGAKLIPYKTIGNIVTFGHYEQDKDESNGKEEIEWIVLEAEDNKVLLLSKYGLDEHCYQPDFFDKAVTWSTSDIRKWLNSDFMNAAFNREEQKAVLLTDVDNSPSTWRNEWSANVEKNTKDKVFLLSYAEEYKYFGSSFSGGPNIEARVSPTEYAWSQGASPDGNETVEGKGASRWWLRSPGDHSWIYADSCCVDRNGCVSHILVSAYDVSVRPAIWLDLKTVLSILN